MRWLWIGMAACVLVGCKPAERCSATVMCGRGSYQACSDGSACRLVASDGSSFACAHCGDCQAATTAVVSWCGAPGATGTGGNGAGTQPQVCADYLACAGALSPSQLPALIATYGPSGSCWQSTPMLAATCTSACQDALAQARMMSNPPAACGGTTAASCQDHVRDGSESDVDCGGSCPRCGDGRSCGAAADCGSGVCDASGHCAAGGVPPVPANAVYRTLPGASVTLPGGPAFAISANAGGSYRLVWIGDGASRQMSGSVATAGSFSSYDPGCGGGCPLGPGDVVGTPVGVAGGVRIDFDSRTGAGPAGFVFSVTSEPVYFELYVDGVARVDAVYFPGESGQTSTTPVLPFGLTTR